MKARSGLLFGIGAYLIWGAFPFYFTLISSVPAVEIIGWRVLTCALFCALAITLTREWGVVFRVLRSAKLTGLFLLSGLLIYANWQIFVFGVTSGRVLETALGYFMTPLLSITIGIVVWKERLSVAQWIAVIVAALGLLVSAVVYGQVPFIALGLAFSFGLYGAVRKFSSVDMSALSGLTIETVLVTPVAVLQLVVVASTVGVVGPEQDPFPLVMLALSGLVTAVPLILFGAANRRLPLSYLGFIQFLTPVLSFVYGAFILQESMGVARWIGFVAVWIAIVFIIADAVRSLRRTPRHETVVVDQVDPPTGELSIVTEARRPEITHPTARIGE